MSKYQAYPEYKDSEIEWLGDIPTDWKIVRLKFATSLVGTKTSPINAKYVGMENISSNNGKYIETVETMPEGISNSFSTGDVLFGKLRPYLAKSWLATFSGICSSEFLVLASRLTHPKYLNYFMLTDEFIEQVNSSTYGSKMPRASWDFIGLLPIPVMNYELSQKIATFLDYETAKIDTLIEKQQQLIKLLKEKRQAVISHAVTKGLNPDAPMKDSGVEWLGEVPAHLELIQMRRVVKYSQGIQVDLGDQLYSPQLGYVKFLRIENYTQDSEDFRYINTSKISACLTKNSDLVVVRYGASAGYVAKGLEGILANNLFNICSKNHFRLTTDFLFYVLKSLYNYLQLEMSGSAMPALSFSMLDSIYIPLPSISEQIKICQHIEKSLNKIDILFDKSIHAIELMQERRTALISAAVTGKIDVRTPAVTPTRHSRR